ncbi:MAG: pentapeptide repeat-containing protein [Thiotrichaceae bacterium]|nr:pentapeptide repeat-containing protein [Thiotrichaceae bacterium]
MKLSYFIILLVFTNVVLASQELPSVPKVEECTGKYVNKKLDQTELNEIIDQHGQWLKEIENLKETEIDLNDTRRANLCGSDLSFLNLNRKDLSRAILRKAYLYKAKCEQTIFSKADLRGANLNEAYLFNAVFELASMYKVVATGADFNSAIMRGATINYANMRDVNLNNAKLNDANLYHTNLNKADLSYTNLTNAQLSYAKLENAKIYQTILHETILDNANIKNAIFFPKLGNLPNIFSFSSIKNFDTVIFQLKHSNSAPAMLELRNALRRVGVEEKERMITQMIYKTKQEKLKEQNYWFYLTWVVLFEWTCDYGLKPWQPLVILLALLIVFTGIYFIFMFFGFNVFAKEIYLINYNPQKSIMENITMKEYIDYTYKNYSWSKLLLHLFPLLFMLFILGFILLLASFTILPEPFTIIPNSVFVLFSFTLLAVIFSLLISDKRVNMSDNHQTHYQTKICHVLWYDKIFWYFFWLLWIGLNAFYLSLLSAFKIGWQNQDYGNWSISYFLKLLLTKEYSIEVYNSILRTICGVQSIISLYLFILWLMLMFWRPFG